MSDAQGWESEFAFAGVWAGRLLVWDGGGTSRERETASLTPECPGLRAWPVADRTLGCEHALAQGLAPRKAVAAGGFPR